MPITSFANNGSAVCTNSQTASSTTGWAMTGSTLPAASATNVPPTQFHIVDAAAPSEIILVTVCDGSASPTLTVTRAAEGTTGVTHAANATYYAVLTAGDLANFKQATQAATSAVTVASTTETVVASFQPVTADITAGASFEAVAYGTFSNSGSATHIMAWRLRWGGLAGTALCEILTGTNAPAMLTTAVAGSSFDCNGTVTLISTTSATANLNLFYTNSTNSLTAAQATATATNATTGGASSSTAVTISGNGPLVLTFAWITAATNLSITATAPLIYRAA